MEKVMTILDGKKISQKIKEELKERVEKEGLQNRRLEIVLVGDDFGSVKYVQMKQKAAHYIGVKANINRLDATSSTESIVSLINSFNDNPDVHGIMIQLPLPEGIDSNKVLESINPKKDVDGLTATNLGLLYQKDKSAIASATPLGIMKLLDEYDIELSGKNVVIIGRSSVVGLPLCALLLAKDATVTVCHSKTEDIKDITKNADILVTSMGKGKSVDSEWIKDGVILIDVGIDEDSDGNIVGDVDFDSVKEKCSYITPVPGGVGPMTVVSLLDSLISIEV